MFDEQDRAYFAQRARKARKLASEATDNSIRKIHVNMAEEYERRAQGEAPRTIIFQDAATPGKNANNRAESNGANSRGNDDLMAHPASKTGRQENA